MDINMLIKLWAASTISALVNVGIIITPQESELIYQRFFDVAKEVVNREFSNRIHRNQIALEVIGLIEPKKGG